tara:strand:- start:29530 stop:30165 length:636 start_codon:yes stop_codon:yes gene_type:complete
MRFTKIGSELSAIITPFSDWFFQQDLTELNELAKANEKNTGESIDYCCGEDYLDIIVKKDGQHIGYPEISYSYDMNMDRTPAHFRKPLWDMNTELCAYLGARNTAVSVYYPEGGFMGWHNNWNAHGYNILLSYTKNGGGYFKFRDPESRIVNTMYDPEGWSSKVGYYGRGREPDKVYYHCAGTTEPRITLGFVVPDEDMWLMMIEDIESDA